MAASMWRMNGLWRRMAGLLVLYALLLSNEVMCQDDTVTDATDVTDAPAADPAAAVSDAADSAAAPATDAPDGGAAATDAAGGESATSAAPADISLGATIINIVMNPDKDGDATGTSGTTAAPVVGNDVAAVTDVPIIVKLVPQVRCVGEGDIPQRNVKAVVDTADCEATKSIILENPAGWCATPQCDLKISQSDKTMMMTSDDSDLHTLAKVLQSEPLRDKLGVKSTVTTLSSPGPSVFVGILVSGLLAALAITVGYFKCQRRSDTKGVRLAEEAYPVDQENQGNTLVSVAPLNPPPETQEKPSINGESPEAAKTQPPPPTNGHSTTKTADTEL